MTATELREKYDALYNLMATSGEQKYMETFGKVMSKMMDWMLANRTEQANGYIEELCSIRWKNYLTTKEADSIVAQMQPRPTWTKEQWKAAMQEHGYALEEEPCYNSCSMYVTMAMIYSDSLDTLTRYVAEGDVFKMAHALALDKLKDRDGVFDVRRYFGL